MKMKLHYAPASPFARKVRMVALETGLDRDIESHVITVSPVNPNSELARDNPLMKVPTLIAADGTALFDSRVICEYLDALHQGRKLFPATGPARWQALRQQALCDGILDAAVLCRYEAAVRPEQYRWSEWRSGQLGKIAAALAALEREAASLEAEFTIGSVTAACALGYLDFRLPDVKWRDSAPGLARWFGKVSARPSFQATAPVV
jgi:glutathione S-transferase